MKGFPILIILLISTRCENCTCLQLLSQSDCTQNTSCQWTNNSCNVITTVVQTYCNQITTTNCASTYGCMLYDNQCTQFTGCASFYLETNVECQNISSQCISDGTACVMLDACKSYKTKSTCSVNASGNTCFWDGKICTDTDTCSKLPYTNNQKCRNAKSTCTVNSKGTKCMNASDCKNYTSQIQCFTNRDNSINCIWIDDSCRDYTCANGSTTFTTNDECESYKSGCTTTGSGCITRTTCDAITVKEGCIIDQTGAKCYWLSNYSICVNRLCSHAPTTINSNIDCANFLKGCIAKFDGGCALNKYCQSAQMESACQSDSQSRECIWNNGICKLKTCVNLPISTNLTLEYCETLMSTCTAGTQTCIDKTCDNAPITITDCQSYKSNCVNLINGGCQQRTTCSSIQIQSDCTIDINQNECLFYDNQCNDKNCNLIPSSNCNSTWNMCIQNENQCLDYTCVNIPNEDSCSKDAYNKQCIYKPTCYKKSCYSVNYTTHIDCNKYLNTCTVNNTINGCMDLVNDCSAYLIEDSCVEQLNGDVCIWQDDVCQPKSCSTADNSLITMEECNQYLQGCVLQSNSKGCTTLPTNCQDRLLEQVCLYDQNCWWSDNKCLTITTICQDTPESHCTNNCIYVNSTCVDNICSVIPHSSHLMCNKLNSKCTVDSQRTKCIELLDNCNGYINQFQCFKVTSGNKCYWNGTQCQNASCNDPIDVKSSYGTYDQCYDYLNQCTVISKLNQDVCTIRISNCNEYTYSQCTYTIDEIKCIWADGLCHAQNQFNCTDIVDFTQCESIMFQCKMSGEQCVNKSCAEITNSNNLLTYNQCQEYNTNCSVLTNRSTCVDIQTSCINYIDSTCIRSQTGPCHFSSQKCVDRDQSLSCSTVRLDVYTDQGCKEFKSFCKLNTTSDGCVDIGCTNYSGYTTLAQCEAIDVSCTVNATKSGCSTKASLCSNYLQSVCVKAIEGYCVFVNNACSLYNSSSNTCNQIQQFQYTDLNCNSVNINCTQNADQTACIQKQNNCQSYQSTTDCLISTNSQCYYNGSACQTFTDQVECANIKQTKTIICQSYSKCTYNSGDNCIQRTCDNFTYSDFTQCTIWLSTCVQNAQGNSCIQFQSQCSQYSTDNCFQSNKGYCYVINSLCQDIDNSIQCESMPNDFRCNLNMKCMLINNNCVDKTCQNYILNSYTHQNCQEQNVECTTSQNQCQDYQNLCITYKSDDTCTYAKEGECLWNNNLCVLKQCNLLTDCTSFTCTLVKQAGCQNLESQCNQYESNLQCQFSSNSQCYWTTSDECVDLKCENLKGTGFNNYTDCQNILDSCTIKGNVNQQCMDKQECQNYNYSVECQINVENKECQWTSQGCQLKECINLVLEYYSHSNCYAQSINNVINQCTVNKNENGCISLSQCEDYMSQDACVLDINQELCAWKDQQCNIKSCLTGIGTTHNECNNYLASCTVNQQNDGCVTIPQTCVEMTQSQCVVNWCSWINNVCTNRTCLNAPSTVQSDNDCNQYLNGCGFVTNHHCFYWECEDEYISTHNECYQKYQCSSNGTSCVRLQEECKLYNSSISCVIASDNTKCQWVEDEAICQDRSCDNAPTSYTTELECNTYFAGCTSKINGGCILKTTCVAAKVQSACTTASDATICTWENNACRNIICSDLSGSTHQQCLTQMSTCSLGLNGKCATQTICQNKTTQQTCIYGTDGPCLWINSTCYLYTGCTSISWTTNDQCKTISSLCTTNGVTCTPIKKCSSNTVSGCYTGSDGECIISLVGSTKTCQLYSSCSQAPFTTHSQCQQANVNCTTDTISACISLQSCNSYIYSDQCFINKEGIQYTQEGYIESTGICVWDGSTCRNQQCIDLIGQTHDKCFSQLVGCTTNGQTCIQMKRCVEYTSQNLCTTATSTDGKCIWSNNQCQLFLCSDITSPTSQSQCQSSLDSCIFDGKLCINKNKCSSYVTQIACNQGGIDYDCIWENEKCSDFSECSNANNQQTICNKNSYCLWTSTIQNNGTSNSTITTCSNHTCSTWYSKTLECKPFLMFDNNGYTYCQLLSGNCTKIDSSSFDQSNCYTYSLYTYTWDSNSQKCKSCFTEYNSSNGSNPTNNTDNQTVNNNGVLTFIWNLIFIYLIY